MELLKLFKEETKNYMFLDLKVEKNQYVKATYDSIVQKIQVAELALTGSNMKGVDKWIISAGERLGNLFDNITDYASAYAVADVCTAEIDALMCTFITTECGDRHKALMDELHNQELDKNRIITKMKYLPIGGNDYDDLYDVLIYTDCGGWSSKIQHLCYSVEKLDFKGKTVAEAKQLIDETELLAKILWRIDKLAGLSTYNLFNNIENKYLKQLVDVAEEMAIEIFLHDADLPDFYAINKMVEKGFRVYPADQDSYGWLSACVETPNKHILVFG